MTIEDGETCVGSGRSIPTIDLHGALESVSDLFTHFGGHEFACGFSLEARNLPALRARLHELFETFEESTFRREARVDATLTLSEIDAEFLAAHEMLQPFGAGNAQPLFLVHDVTVTGTRTFAEDCCELALRDPTGTATAVLWPSVKGLDVVSGAVDLLVKVEPDKYRGIRLEVVDARLSS
jgi:single-stranded-DNA-specific exonuclease